jgi:hypothetical protein
MGAGSQHGHMAVHISKTLACATDKNVQERVRIDKNILRFQGVARF